jgi:predicted Rossmann fold flavoprotein
VAVVGAGAAGLLAAIVAARDLGPRRVVLLDSARRPGAKILVSGGGRCNVTNRVVGERDFAGGAPHLVRRVLRAFTEEDTVAFFRGLGVALHEEEHGKLFPDSQKARTVLDALLVEAARRGVELRAGTRVSALEAAEDGIVLHSEGAPLRARRVVLATGGLSLPKTGSDGHGYALARSLGHSLVPTTPALVPLVLEGRFHPGLSGVAVDSELRVLGGGAVRPVRGALLFTHFGVSGPAALDVSRHLLRERLLGHHPRLVARLLPGMEVGDLEQAIVAASRVRPRAGLRGALEGRLPAAVADAVLREEGLSGRSLAQWTREERRRVARALVERELEVRESRGYGFAEATAGGVPLEEVDLRTMESRLRPGLHLAGEILDVDGRLGGFNFQWAWSSGFVAGRGVAAAFRPAIMPPSNGGDAPCP